MNNLRTILSLAPDILRGVGGHITVTNPPYLPLSIEHIGLGPRGLPALSVTHYGEQNGDAMGDPEMCFELEIDNGEVREFHPYYFRNDYLGLEQTSVRAVGRYAADKVLVNYDVFMVRGQSAFAETWDRNLGSQGFVTALQKKLQRTIA